MKSRLLVIASPGADARGIALQVAQPGTKVQCAPIQPRGICQSLGEKGTTRRCHFVTHACVKLHNATQVLDDRMESTRNTLPTLADAESVGHFSEAVLAQMSATPTTDGPVRMADSS